MWQKSQPMSRNKNQDVLSLYSYSMSQFVHPNKEKKKIIGSNEKQEEKVFKTDVYYSSQARHLIFLVLQLVPTKNNYKIRKLHFFHRIGKIRRGTEIFLFF